MSHLAGFQPDSVLSYLIAFALPALDAVFPLVPSESAIVALGVVSVGSLDPRVLLLVVLAAAGAFVGDNACYVIGRRFGPRLDKRVFATERGRKRRAWAQRALDGFGVRMIIAARFVPGGRTVVALTCGAVQYPWHRFAPAAALSGVLWASYAYAIGRIGGSAFADRPWLGLLVALGLTVVVGLIADVVRRIVSRRRCLPSEAS
jgi:membrane protein DedA with SNARE-associated domain